MPYKVKNISNYKLEVIIDNEKKFIDPNSYIIVETDNIKCSFPHFIVIENYIDEIKAEEKNEQIENEDINNDEIGYNELSFTELKKIAKEKGIKIPRKIKKIELIKLLKGTS